MLVNQPVPYAENEFDSSEDVVDIETVEDMQDIMGVLPIVDVEDDDSEDEDFVFEDSMEEHEVLELTDVIRGDRSNGLCRCYIENLPVYTFPSEGALYEAYQTSCVVCLCDFEDKQLLRVLPCSHDFHAECVDKWLQTNRFCPVCRHDATDTETYTEEGKKLPRPIL